MAFPWLAASSFAAAFYLQHEASGRAYGPYKYEQGSIVGEGQGRCELLVEAPSRFQLKSLHEDKVWGPFELSHGEKVIIAGAEFSLLLESSGIKGRVSYSRAIGSILVDLVPVTQGLSRNLARLRNTFDLLDKQHQRRTAPVQTGPRITGMAGYRRDGIAVASQHDEDKSRARRDRQAQPLMASVVKGHSRRQLKLGRDASFEMSSLAPGRYLLVGRCTGRKADKESTSLSELVYWWQVVDVATNETREVTWSGENSMNWEEFYEFILRDENGMVPER